MQQMKTGVYLRQLEVQNVCRFVNEEFEEICKKHAVD
jgi:hypothetical protein